MTGNSAQKKKDTNPIGRLKSIGVKTESQIPLILPKGYKDYSKPVQTVQGYPMGESILLPLNRKTMPKTSWDGAVPKTTALFTDDYGIDVWVTFFGDARDAKDLIVQNSRVYISGRLGSFNNNYQISNPEIVPNQNIGRFIPSYQGKARVIKADKVREKVLASMDKIVEGAQYIRSMMGLNEYQVERELLTALGAGNVSLEELIQTAHLPNYENEGHNASAILKKLSALFTIRLGRANVDDRLNTKSVVTISKQDLVEASKGIPYPLTDEQKKAIWGLAQELSEPRQIQSLISADVGAGKSSILGMIARTASLNGAFVVIMAPNTTLCSQLIADFKKWWPDIDASLVIGDTKGLPDSSVLIGTTALLHRLKKSKRQPDILMVDEEHRFGNKQREQLKAAHTNYVGSTATCVPRTMQMVSLGAYSVYRLTKIHVKKEIDTQVVTAGETSFLMDKVKETLGAGRQALVIYPVAEKGEPLIESDSPKKDAISAERAKEIWEKKYPGRVALVHGKMTDEEKLAAIESLKDGTKDLLVSTTVVEVGIHIPKLQTAIVVNAERYGLSQLHQIRGRVAREGGKGYFYLYLPNEPSEDTLERMHVMENISDGFQIAEEDLRIRGFGDLAANSENQKGNIATLIPNYDVTVEDVKQLIEMGLE